MAKSALGQNKEAILDFDEALKLDPENAGAYRGRGLAKRPRRQYKDSRADFRKALELDPELEDDRVRWLMKYPVVEEKSEVLENALNFQKIKPDKKSHVYSAFAQFKHWYYFKEHDIFAPSKFIGYKSMTIPKYKQYGDGRETEEVLPKWFDEIDKNSEEYRRIEKKLHEFARSLDKKPKTGFVIHVEKDIKVTEREKSKKVIPQTKGISDPDELEKETQKLLKKKQPGVPYRPRKSTDRAVLKQPLFQRLQSAGLYTV